MSFQPTRRGFVRSIGTLGLTAPLIWPRLTRAASANGKLNHACIGVNGMGWVDLNNIHRHDQVEIAAICDVDLNRRKQAEDLVPEANRYQDWRELLEKEGDRIDSVNVAVPDHNHALITINALRGGKHVYCQKPLCHDVAEVRAVAQETEKAGVVTQLGTQHASGIGDRMAVQFLREGVIGKVKHVYLCSNRPGAVDTYRLKGPRPDEGQTPPEHLNWDWWLGTAPERPFAPDIYHPRLWRAWQDFGTGWSGDIGCHIFSAPWLALGLTAPKTVRAHVQGSWRENEARRNDTWPQSDHIVWTFPGNEKTAADELTVEWFDGYFFPPPEVQAMYAGGDRFPGEAAMIIGTEGSLLLPHGSGPLLYPKEKFRRHPRPQLPGQNHYHRFIDGILEDYPTKSRFEVTGPMTETILLGTVAIRVPGTTLQWDSGHMRITNHTEANQYIQREYRDGWAVPGLA